MRWQWWRKTDAPTDTPPHWAPPDRIPDGDTVPVPGFPRPYGDRLRAVVSADPGAGRRMAANRSGRWRVAR